jgi:prepilin-type processing-associated H-X9-DG protein
MGRMRIVDVLVIVAALIFLLGMVPPTLCPSREITRRAKCASNLKEIIVGIREYAMEHDGYYPTIAEPGQSIVVSHHYKDLGILYPGYVASLDVFTCPSSGDRMPRRDDPGGTYDNKPFRSTEATQCSYAYSYDGTGAFNKAWTEAAPSTTRILADRKATVDLDFTSNHWMEGRNVARADGHVRWVSGKTKLKTDPDNPDTKINTQSWWSER